MSSQYYDDFEINESSIGRMRRRSMGSLLSSILFWIAIGLAAFFLLTLVVWLVWYRRQGIRYFETARMLIRTIISWVFWPIRFVLELLGFITTEVAQDTATIVSAAANIIPKPPHTTHTTVVKREIAECPPCEVTCEEKDCPKVDTKPFELEIAYLKDMVKLVGTIAQRENAINAQYQELYPGFSVLSPAVRRLSHEYNYIKNDLRKDSSKWQYFKNYFSKLTGIPSTSSDAIHYDVEL